MNNKTLSYLTNVLLCKFLFEWLAVIGVEEKKSRNLLTLGTVALNRAWAQPNRALVHLFQLGQGLLNEPRPSTARSAHTSQTNRALGVKRSRAQFKTPIVSTP